VGVNTSEEGLRMAVRNMELRLSADEFAAPVGQAIQALVV
jgi:hypothetical protein